MSDVAHQYLPSRTVRRRSHCLTYSSPSLAIRPRGLSSLCRIAVRYWSALLSVSFLKALSACSKMSPVVICGVTQSPHQFRVPAKFWFSGQNFMCPLSNVFAVVPVLGHLVAVLAVFLVASWIFSCHCGRCLVPLAPPARSSVPASTFLAVNFWA